MSRIVIEEWAFEVPCGQQDIAAYIGEKVNQITADTGDSEYVRVSAVMHKGSDIPVELTVEKEIADMNEQELTALRDQLEIQLDELDETEPDEEDEEYGDWMLSVDETEQLMSEVIAALAEIS